MTSRIAVVTGANRGIGLEVVRQLAAAGDTVILGSRDLAKGTSAAAKLTGDIHPVELDVADPTHPIALAQMLESQFGRLDVLVNNAAIHYDTWQSASGADLAIVREAFETNVLGAWQVTQALLPVLRRSEHPRIVNVSSEAGSLASMGPFAPAYNVSKASLNALTVMWAKELRGFLVNSICPGWVATDMGGPGGRPVREGAGSIMWAINLPDNGPTGGFYRDGNPIPW